MNAMDKLRQRKARLRGEIKQIEAHLQDNSRKLEQYRPHRFITRLALDLLKTTALRSGVGILQSLLSKNGEVSALDRKEEEPADKISPVWRMLIHQGIDLILNALDKPKVKEEKKLEVEYADS